jgi:hypothetical protein
MTEIVNNLTVMSPSLLRKGTILGVLTIRTVKRYPFGQKKEVTIA